MYILPHPPADPCEPHSPNSSNPTAKLATLADPNELFLPGERQNNLAMQPSSSTPSPAPVPLLNPPVPGAPRNNTNDTSPNNATPPPAAPIPTPFPAPSLHPNPSPRRPPKLKLGIPPSPTARPVHDNGVPDVPDMVNIPQRSSARPAAPQLRLATPMGGQEIPREGRPAPPPLITTNSSESNGLLDGKASGPASATSSTYSALSFAMGLRQPHGGTPDPSSAISSVYSDRDGAVAMQRDNSVNGLLPDLDKLSLEKGRPLDVEDLDDEGLLAASEQKMIVELGSLGEGAGGAVTRCKLKDGKTVFALKVCWPIFV